jgi:hypothetical protein
VLNEEQKLQNLCPLTYVIGVRWDEHGEIMDKGTGEEMYNTVF